MELGLEGKVVLITGGSKGIGLACAFAFAAEGARIAICSRASDNVEQARAQLKDAFGVAADLTDADAAAKMIEEVEGCLGQIDVLVNSAGAAKRTPPDDLTPAVWREAFDAKFFSYINAIDPVVKRMAKRGSGVIVSVIGVGGKVASATHLAGGPANAALMLATAGLGGAYAGKGVRVVAVSPGLTERRTGWRRGSLPTLGWRIFRSTKRAAAAWPGCRSAAWPRQARSPTRSFTSPRRGPATSPASPYRWTAGRTQSFSERRRAARADCKCVESGGLDAVADRGQRRGAL
jgi:NAD(P)-dependent dehydrogenase (short-subunit alcohol dehydrogenase family)